MSTTCICKVCGAAEDTWDHALLHCTMSKCVWALMDNDLAELIATTNIKDPKDWLFYMLDVLKPGDRTKLLVSCWAIWRARRRVLHDEFYESPLTRMHFIKSYLADMDLINIPLCLQDKKHLTYPKVPVWMPPPEDCVKINVDAAISRWGNKGAVGAVCHTVSGEFVAASAMVWEGLSDSATLEALGCNEGLAIAMGCNMSEVCIASDCLEVIRSISKKPRCQYLAVLNDIEARRKHFAKVEFRHENQACNFDAHNLAKFASTLQEGCYLWFSNPPCNMNRNVNVDSNK
ncbi:Os02g0566300 [Oryza sativa Japonica Group]|uniref:Os02g0566300 protein n=1 Tax=Oryza sativa subsp. japonica TaxID=39947 RepID=Q0E0A4_ORYSJ|nr:hypothetical protein DAI22_02g213350 [Oryza sativa Japonica Group]BAF09084.1 Os02g0566300 [Oryza sativa Japonica Group]|eukprot:NP_001047170.1 Os02g0566300 [Oryza sativa Japonica Group]